MWLPWRSRSSRSWARCERDGYVVVEGVLDRETVAATSRRAPPGPGRDPDWSQRLRGLRHPAHLPAVRQDPRVRRPGHPPGDARRARPGPRPLPARARRPASRSGPASRRRSSTGTTRSTRCPSRTARSSSTPCGRSTTSPRRTARPGSCPAATAGRPDRQPTGDERVVQTEMPAGSVAFYTGSIWHGGGANQHRSRRGSA